MLDEPLKDGENRDVAVGFKMEKMTDLGEFNVVLVRIFGNKG